MTRTLKFGVALLVVLVLGLGGSAGAHSFTAGYYYATGTVRPMGISFYMQGSHYLESSSGGTICLLSSTKYDLSMYEGDKVRVSGWTEHTVEGSSQIMRVSGLTVLSSSRRTIAHRIIKQGSFNQLVVPAGGANYVITDAEVWDRAVTAMGDESLRDPALNGIDFTKHMVLAMFMGQQTSTAHYIEVNKVERAGDRTFVTSTNHAPPAGSRIATVITNPFVLVRVSRATGKTWFNNKKADELVLEAGVTLRGHVTVSAGVDASKVKVGVFSANDLARYFQWPGNMPGDVAPLAANGNYSRRITSPLPGSEYEKYYVIAFQDLDGNNITNGDLLVVSTGVTFSAGAWHKVGTGVSVPPGGSLTLNLALPTATTH